MRHRFMIALLALLLAGTAGAATLNPADSIQAAIDAAVPDEVIFLTAGTYNLTTTLNVNKPVTIEGASEADVTINASTVAGYGLIVTSHNVILRKFAISPPDQNYPIHASGTTNLPNGYDNLTIENVTISGSHRRTGFDINGYNNVVLSHLTSSNAYGGNGLQISGCIGVTIDNITTALNAWGSIAVYVSKPGQMNRGSQNVVIDGDTLNLGEGYLFMQDESGLFNTNITVTGYEYTVRNTTFREPNTDSPGYTIFDDTLANAITRALSFTGHVHHSSIRQIATGQLIVVPGLSIQAAIDAAAPGDIIDVAAGDYTENILVNKRVALVGEGSGTDPLDNTVLHSAPPVDAYLGTIQISGSGLSELEPVLFKDFRVAANGIAAFSIGRFTDALGVSVSYVKLDNVHVVGTNSSGMTEQERGLFVDSTSSLEHLVVTDCAFNNLGHGWIFNKQVSAEPSTVRYVDVTNTTFTHNDLKGIYAEKLADATFTGCTVNENGYSSNVADTFKPWLCGIDINLKAGDYSNLEFIDCDIVDNGLGNAREGSGITLKGRGTGNDPSYSGMPATLDNVVIRDCYIEGNERGIRLGEPGKLNQTPTNVVVRNSQIFNNVKTYSGTDGSEYGDLVMQSTSACNAIANWWGDQDPSDQVALDPGAGAGLYSPWLGAVPGTVPMTWWVNPTGLIQTAIDLAAPGETVNATAGTFQEQLVIAKSLILTGAGMDQTVVLSPPILPAVQGTHHPVVLVRNAAPIAISNLTVDGDGRGNANYKFVGIGYYNAGGSVVGCEVEDVRDTPFSGAQHCVGIYNWSDDNLPHSLSVQDCVIHDFQKNAMALNASDTTPQTISVTGCSVTGYGATDVTAQNGIQVWAPSGTAVIQNNTVSAIGYDNTNASTQWVASSILNFYTPVQILDNSVSGAQVGIYNYAAAGVIDGNQLGVLKIGLDGVGIVATDPDRRVPSPYSDDERKPAGDDHAKAVLNVAITNNNVAFSGADNTNTVGVECYAGYDTADDLAVTATGNTVTGFDYGMLFQQLTYSTGVFTNVLANQNVIAGNTTYGMYSDLDYLTIDATCNWWGNLAGPDVPGNPSPGDAIFGDVEYSPWLNAAGGACTQFVDEIDVTSPTACLTPTNACAAFTVSYDREPGANVRGVSVTLQLSSELTLCDTDLADLASNFVILTGAGSLWNGFGNLQTQIYANGGNSYTVDMALLGSPCGPTTDGTLFTVSVAKAADVLTDDTGTVTVTGVTVRDCANAPLGGVPGTPGTITIDLTAPATVTNLVVAQDKTVNGADGRTAIDLTWTAPVGDHLQRIEIYRKGFGFYPEYDDAGGAVPALPLDGTWQLVVNNLLPTVVAYSDLHTATTRDFWYYAVKVIDDCGNSSVVMSTTGTLNYHLGDVAPLATPGDNLVNTLDVSALGSSYGITLAPNDPVNYLDVGPTTNYSVNARPTTDNMIQFEDLIVFAMNYGLVSKESLPTLTPAAESAVIAKVGTVDPANKTLEVELAMSGDGRIQGLSVPLTWNAEVVRPVSFNAGSLIADQGGLGMVLSPEPGTIDAAIFGVRNQGICGTGTLAIVTFEVLGAGDPGIGLGDVVARDPENQNIAVSGTLAEPVVVAPLRTELLANVPNPFNPSTELSFMLAQPGSVRLQIYSVQGRLVATLVNGELAAGRHDVTWRGLDDSGRAVASGAYIVRLDADGDTQSRRITLMK